MHKTIDEVKVPAPEDETSDSLTLARLARAIAGFGILAGVMMIPTCMERSRHIDATASETPAPPPPETIYFPGQYHSPQGEVRPHVEAF